MTAADLMGQITGPTYQDINILFSDKGVIEGRGVMDASHAYNGARTGYEDEILQGTPLARITASKLFVPCKRTAVKTGGGATAQAIPVNDARAFKVGETITVGGDTGKTIASIDYSTNTITVSDVAFAFADGDAVFCDSLAGSEKCVGFLNSFVKLAETGYVDPGTWRHRPFSHLILAGMIDPTLIQGDLAAIRADTAAEISGILWADTQGQQ